MRASLDAFTPVLLELEGGYANHPQDPGGPTNHGVTQATYDAFRKDRRLAQQSVQKITDAEVQTIFKTRYWDIVLGDELPAGVDVATYDTAVNSGPPRGAKLLQAEIGAKVDGVVGRLETVPKANAAPDKAKVVQGICRRRLSFLHGLGNWEAFKRGWSARVATVETFGVRLAMEAAGHAPVTIAARAEAESRQADQARRSEANGAKTTTGLGGGGALGVDQLDPSASILPAILIVIVAVAIAGIFLWRARAQKARAAAYQQLAKGA